jgi:hypothetical protein
LLKPFLFRYLRKYKQLNMNECGSIATQALIH